jgi:predicted Rossmann fold nucleotide-binding protein DprA/Smf involved in DNA uptake
MATKTVLTPSDRFVKQLRKTPKTLAQVAEELGVPYQGFSRILPGLLSEGKVIKHEGKVAKYSRA